MFHQDGALGLHGGVLLGAVAARHHDGDGNAGAAARVGEGLAVIAAGGGDDAADAGAFAFQAIEVGEATPHLERAGGRVVFVLHPHFGAGPGREEWPGVGRGGWEGRVDDGGGGFEFGEGEHRRSITRECRA